MLAKHREEHSAGVVRVTFVGEEPIEDFVGHGLGIDARKDAGRSRKCLVEMIAVALLENRALSAVEAVQPRRIIGELRTRHFVENKDVHRAGPGLARSPSG